MDILKNEDIIPQVFEHCHEGEGALLCRSLLDGLGSEKFGLLHLDDIPAGVSIGVHPHTDEEEIYYLLSGKGSLTASGGQDEQLSLPLAPPFVNRPDRFLLVGSQFHLSPPAY